MLNIIMGFVLVWGLVLHALFYCRGSFCFRKVIWQQQVQFRCGLFSCVHDVVNLKYRQTCSGFERKIAFRVHFKTHSTLINLIMGYNHRIVELIIYISSYPQPQWAPGPIHLMI